MNVTSEGKLIFDVGMHTGEDTGYYLYKGHRVVAIEANPELVRRGERRFHAAIAAGRLTILGVGIAGTRGEAEFFISTKRGVWSSFDRANATRGGSGCRAVRVPCLPFADVLERFGVPHYLKVDIEGNDRLCIRDLRPTRLPRFLSIEMCHGQGDEDIRTLADLGYDRFKCVRQNDFAVLGTDMLGTEERRRRRAAALGLLGQAARALRGAARRIRRPRDGAWVFPAGSSGRFGDELPGRWQSATEMLAVWQLLSDLNRELTGAGLGDWFDIHAAHSRSQPGPI